MDLVPSSSVQNRNNSLFQSQERPQCDGHVFSSARNSFVVDRVQFLGELGKGGYGEVRSVKYLGDTRAVKALHSLDEKREESSEPRNSEEELEKEARIMEQKRSTYIVSLFRYIPEKKWLVMEYCENGSLQSVILSESKRKIVLEWKNRLKWVWQIAKGMNVMHNEPPPVIHRDLNPKNIFMTAYYNIRIGDFGLSKQLPTDEDMKRSDSMNMHCMVWQPPEVMKERRYSTKSDVYSFGVIMHQLLMIDGPYGLELCRNELNARVCAHVIRGEGLNVPKDRNLIPGKWHPCLEKYIELMYKCCAFEPEDRPEFDEICTTLAKVQQEYKNASRVKPKKKRISAQFLKKVLVFSALATFSLFSVSELLKSSRDVLNADAEMCNGTQFPMNLICIYFGMLCIFGSALCLAWETRRGMYNFSKERLFKPVKSYFRCVCDWFEEWNIQEDQNVPLRSPFQVGPSFRGSGSDFSDSGVASLPIPDPELWKEIRAAFISELHERTDTGLLEILGFCLEHKDERLRQQEWEDFIRLLSRESKVTRTDVWRRYRDHLTIPNFFTREVFSSHDIEQSSDETTLVA